MTAESRARRKSFHEREGQQNLREGGGSGRGNGIVLRHCRKAVPDEQESVPSRKRNPFSSLDNYADSLSAAFPGGKL